MLDRRSLLRSAAAIALSSSSFAFAQTFPSKPVRIVVPASAGTSIDAMARFFAEPLSKRLNTPVVVENRSGAGGLLGYTAAAKSPADGYTLILTGIPLYLLPLFSELTAFPFDPAKDFAAVARVGRVPFAIVVPVDSPYKSMSDLLQAMKSSPDNLTYSSQGVGSSAHLCSVILNDMSRTKAKHIGYKETSVALTDVVAGRISFTCQTSTGVIPLIEGGRLRALAVTGARRWDALPDVPTVAEAGVKGFEVSSQLDFMAPAHTPDEILGILSDHITQIASTQEFKSFCVKQVIAPEAMGTKALTPEIGREVMRWKSVAQLARPT